jgi:predicted metal-dependent HD superfamily phosphohydrolase
METELINKARVLAENTFSGKVFEKHNFHNLFHTQEVVRAAEIIGLKSDLTDDEMESVLIAAWLHDIGYEQGSQDHEAVAADRARKMLEEAGAPPKKTTDVIEAIESTKMPQQPKSIVGKVLCDADLFHLSTEKCDENGYKLRDEWKSLGFKDMEDDEWVQFNLHFMESHRYHTTYGQNVLEEGKKKNIKRLRKMLTEESDDEKDKKVKNKDKEKSKEKDKDRDSKDDMMKLEAEVNKLREKLKKAKAQKPDRGIETMFRTTSHNHILLSEMADNKANILITINSIILSIVVSVLVRKLEENPRLLIPTVLLVMVCLATTVFAILSTRPIVNTGTFTREDIHAKKTNLLFFGNFFGMNLPDYEWGMREMMKDSEYLYGSLIKDIYYLGKVLGRKYKYLRIAYNIFMFGFVLSILSFMIALALSPKPPS